MSQRTLAVTKTTRRRNDSAGQRTSGRARGKGCLEVISDAVAMQEVDQDRLCCGGLLLAEVGSGPVVLRCLSCGQRWERGPDGTLTAASPREPSEEVRKT